MKEATPTANGNGQAAGFNLRLLFRYVHLLERHVALLEEKVGGRKGNGRGSPGYFGLEEEEFDEDDEIL